MTKYPFTIFVIVLMVVGIIGFSGAQELGDAVRSLSNEKPAEVEDKKEDVKEEPTTDIKPSIKNRPNDDGPSRSSKHEKKTDSSNDVKEAEKEFTFTGTITSSSAANPDQEVAFYVDGDIVSTHVWDEKELEEKKKAFEKVDQLITILENEGEQAILLVDEDELFGPADFNQDGIISMEDLIFLIGEWGECEDTDNCPADLNGDGVVDDSDMFMLLALWDLEGFYELQSADLNNDGVVNGVDLGILLASWGACGPFDTATIEDPCPADINNDGVVDDLDLNFLLAAWGMTFDVDEVTTIHSCGQITESGEYILESGLSAHGTCLNVKAHDVSINCQENTIVYATTEEGFAIKTNGYNNIEIAECKLVQTGDLAITISENSHAIKLRNSEGNNVHDNIIKTNGVRSIGILLNTVIDSQIVDNTIVTEEFRAKGVKLASSSRTEVSGNDIHTQGEQAHAVKLVYANLNKIHSNTLSTIGEQADGVVVTDSQVNGIKENAIGIEGTKGHGVVVKKASSDNTFEENALKIANGDAFRFNLIDAKGQRGNVLTNNEFSYIDKLDLNIRPNIHNPNMHVTLKDQEIGEYDLSIQGMMLRVVDTEAGIVHFTKPVSSVGKDLTGHDILIETNMAHVTDEQPGLTAPAHVELVELPEFVAPIVFKDALPCGIDCENMEINDDTAEFDILGPGTYEVGEDPEFETEDLTPEEFGFIEEESSSGGSSFSQITQLTEWSICSPEGTQSRSVTVRTHSGDLVEQIETQPCTYQPLIEESEEQVERTSIIDPQGLFTRITGAVVGAPNETKAVGVLAFIALLIGLYLIAIVLRRQ